MRRTGARSQKAPSRTVQMKHVAVFIKVVRREETLWRCLLGAFQRRVLPPVGRIIRGYLPSSTIGKDPVLFIQVAVVHEKLGCVGSNDACFDRSPNIPW